MDSMLLAAVGFYVYGKCAQAEAARELRQLQAQQAIDALHQRAQDLQDAVQAMEFDLIMDPGKHSAKHMRAARRRADRAQEAALLAEAGLHRSDYDD